MTPVAVPALVGVSVHLEPLKWEHVADLVRAATQDRSQYGYTSVPGDADAMRRHVGGLLGEFAAGTAVPFVQVDAETGRVVGMTRYLTLRYRPRASVPFALEIGGTWLTGSAQRTRVNTEAKFLLLRHAFEEWGVARVDIKTDDRNERAKVAISRVGATFEGVLRKWQPSQVKGEETSYRDTAMFSIIDEEWPAVAVRLGNLLA